MSYPRTIRNFNAYIDGVSFLGIATMATIPVPKVKTRSHRGAGMEMPYAIDMGIEPMQSKIELAEWSRALFAGLGRRQSMTLRPGEGAHEEFVSRPIIVTMSGLWAEPGFGDLKSGDENNMSLMMEVDHLKVTIAGELLWDVSNRPGAPRLIDGVDQTEQMRRNMGV